MIEHRGQRHASGRTGFMAFFRNGRGNGGALKHLCILAAVLAAMSGVSWAGEPKTVKPAPRDKCPVCGMFVAKYTDFLATIVFKDGSRAFFDGAKDLCKYYFNVRKYNPAKAVDQIAAIYVTDYYRLAPIDGFKAYYVVGSDVYGPMGKELIPFGDKADAEEFMRDHHGKTLLEFRKIDTAVIKDLD